MYQLRRSVFPAQRKIPRGVCRREKSLLILSGSSSWAAQGVKKLRHQQGHDPFSGGQTPPSGAGAEIGKAADREGDGLNAASPRRVPPCQAAASLSFPTLPTI